MKNSKFKLGVFLIVASIIIGILSFVIPFIGFGSEDFGAFAFSGVSAIFLFALSTPLFIGGIILIVIGVSKGNSFDSIKREIDSAFNGENSIKNMFNGGYCEYCGKKMEIGQNVCKSCGAAKSKK